MTGSKTHLIITCHNCGASLTLPVTTYQVGDPNSTTGMTDARQVAAEQNWQDRDGHWTCPACSPPDTEEA
jgi:hypothetical protein